MSGSNDGAPTPDAIMQLGTAFWGSKTLLTAVELKVFAAVSEAGPLDGEQLRDRKETMWSLGDSNS